MSQSIPYQGARPQPVITDETRSFWAGAADGVLCLRKCLACERLAAPLAPRCAGCLGAEFTPETLSGHVRLKGRTVLHLSIFPGHVLPTVVVECAVEEDPRIVLIALDDDNTTKVLAPDAPLTLAFSQNGAGEHFAIVRPSSPLREQT